MFAARVTIFIISLLLVTEAVDPSQGWFIALAVLSGLSMVGLGGVGPRIFIGNRGRRWRWQDQW